MRPFPMLFFARLVPLFVSLLSVLPAQVPAAVQLPAPAELKRLRDEKLAKPVFRKAPWQSDFDAARAMAAKDGKAVLAYFTTSSAPNAQCDALENGPLSDPAFADFAKAFVLFVHCSSKVEGEPRPRLLHELGMAVVPTLCFLDADGKVIVQQRESALGAIVGTGQKVKALSDAQTAAKKGGMDAEKSLFLAELDLDLLTAEQIRVRLPSIQLGDAEKAGVDRKVVDAEIVSLARQAATLGGEEVGRRIAAIHAAGRLPNERHAFPFWGWLLAHAATTKNGPLADEAFTELSRYENPNKDPSHNIRAREEWEKLRAKAKGR